MASYTVNPTGRSVKSASTLQGSTVFATNVTIDKKTQIYNGTASGFGLVVRVTPLHLLVASNRVEHSTVGSLRTNVTAVSMRNINFRISSPVDVSHIDGVISAAFVPFRTDRDEELWKTRQYMPSPQYMIGLPGVRTGRLSQAISVGTSFTFRDRPGRNIGLDTQERRNISSKYSLTKS
ncbi:hypothetical protein M8J76_016588 [Diaphorina citri]|nr:hypothetical protein M8J75_005750 [Diaphorina citri]KAI5724182.1 hypothetical protein M8J76_016588 [Diaphorina citri]